MGASCFSHLCCCCISSNSASRRLPPPPPPAATAYLPYPHMEPQPEAHLPSHPRLPYPDADRTLRALATGAEGFGLHDALYYVTCLQDDGYGMLGEAYRAKEPLWIVFEVSGTIHLETYLRVSSHKTINGRGRQVKLTNKGLQLKDFHHVIVSNLEFEGGRGHDIDGVQIKPNSSNI